ncbi:MAG: HAMP domain-containing sensor histidine kinase, partial [Nitrospirota bacterium]
LILRELIIRDFEEYLDGEREDRIYRIMAAVEGSYEKNSGWNGIALAENTVWALLLGYEIRILDGNGNELMNSQEAVESLSPLMKRRIVAMANFSAETLREREDPFFSYPLFLGGRDIGNIEVRRLGETRQRKETIFLGRSNRFLIISVIALGGLSLLLSFFFSKRLTDPIKRLTLAAQNISEGKMKSRVSIRGSDEISDLAKTFNIMASNLEIQELLRRKLTANIAHELRTPLTIMQGEIEGMVDGLIPVDRERLLSLNEETARLKKIIEGIEELSRAEASILSLTKEQISLKGYLNTIRERFVKLFRDKGVEIDLQCDEPLSLQADPDRLSQILINLLSNALRATGSGDRVTISAGKEGSEVFIEVADTGKGIKKEDIPFIFERFYKDYEGGLGIGLAICKELAEAHGGRIEVRSDYGKGAAFTLYIPEFTTSS